MRSINQNSIRKTKQEPSKAKRDRMHLVYCSALIAILLFGSCSSAPRTKWTDKNMRVMIDPESVSEEHYIQIQQALLKNGAFTVVDRGRGLQAIKKEQERLHRDETDRYADKEKWAHWGKLYGVGSVIVGNAQCAREMSFLNQRKSFLRCKQFLSVVDANSGEVMVAVQGENDSEATYDLPLVVPDWDEVVKKMIDAYPKEFRSDNYQKPVQDYQAISEEHAKRQKERQNENQQNGK